MIKHVVLFQLKGNLDSQTKKEVMENFKNGILALPPYIPCIRYIEVGLNTNTKEEWDICLQADFESYDDLFAYSKHPEHVKVGGELRPFMAGRSCVDYEY